MPTTLVQPPPTEVSPMLAVGLGTSALSAVVALAAGLLIYWNAPDRSENRRGALMMGAVFLWGLAATWLRLTPWLGGLEVVRAAIPLFALGSAHLGRTFVRRSRFKDALSVGAWLLGAWVLLSGRAFSEYAFGADGVIRYEPTPLGRAALMVNALLVVWAIAETVAERPRLHRLAAPLLLLFAAVLSLGVRATSQYAVAITVAALSAVWLTRELLVVQLFDPLRESNQRYRALLDASPDLLLLVDPDGRIRGVDGHAFPLDDAGAVPEPGDQLAKWFPGLRVSDLPAGRTRLERTQRVRGDARVLELRVSRTDKGVMFAVRDITAEKQADRLKAEFVSNVSHELRTPLTSIRGALGMLDLAETPAERAELHAIATRNTERLLLLVNDLLDVQRTEAGAIPVARDALDLPALAEQVARALQPVAGLKQVTVDLRVASGLPAARGDSARLQQVLTNLVDNAIRYAPEGSAVVVSLDAPPGFVRTTVIDRGPGVPSHFRDRLFQRFSQADSGDTRRSGGTGLGLAISRALVERMGGQIAYAPADGGGSAFSFTLPRA